MKTLVVGATGTLGRITVRELRTRGHDVVGVTTSEANRCALETLGIPTAVSDVLDERSIAGLVKVVQPDAVVNLATRIPPGGPRRASDMRPTNRLRREGTRNLLKAARTSGARRYVGESMVFAYGYDGHASPVEEGERARIPRSAGLKEITEAIRDSESQIARATDAGHLEGISLRFGLFHSRAAPSTREMARLVANRRLPLIGGGDSILSWVALEDAATAVALAVEGARPEHVYNVVDDEPVRFADYVCEMARQLGARPPLSVPKWLARPLAPYVAALMDEIRLPVSNVRIKGALGWSPKYPSFRDVIATLPEAR